MIRIRNNLLLLCRLCGCCCCSFPIYWYVLEQYCKQEALFQMSVSLSYGIMLCHCHFYSFSTFSPILYPVVQSWSNRFYFYCLHSHFSKESFSSFRKGTPSFRKGTRSFRKGTRSFRKGATSCKRGAISGTFSTAYLF